MADISDDANEKRVGDAEEQLRAKIGEGCDDHAFAWFAEELEYGYARFCDACSFPLWRDIPQSLRGKSRYPRLPVSQVSTG